MRTAILVLALVGCAAEQPPPGTSEAVDIATIDQTPARDVCALAAGLPADNICSMVCDPDAMKDALRAAGDPDGRCYEFDCTLTDGSSVFVGVCLVREAAPSPERTVYPSAR